LSCLILPLSAPLLAQSEVQQNTGGYPVRPITVISPSPGGGADAVARIVSAAMGRSMNATFVVDARPGAGGNVASEAVARAPADGYTLLLALSSMLTVNPVLYQNARFNPVSDFQPIALLATAPYLLAANPNVGASSVSELVTEAKAKPQSLLYSSSGYGTPSHLTGVLFNTATGADLQHVPYRTTSGATADVISGQVHVMFGSLYSLLPFVRAGKLKALGVTGAARSSFAPEIPTIAESVPGFEFLPWYGLFAPAKTRRDVAERLEVATSAALNSSDVRDRLADQGADVAFGNASELTARIPVELEKWKTVIKASGIRVD
jgi:tripartite-type tricarboxylate transporter receptor subunit TctC